MNKATLLSAAIVAFVLSSWVNSTNKGVELPTVVILKEYRHLIRDTIEVNNSSIKIRQESVTPIVDTSLQALVPGFRFYYLTIFNGAHWEYNNGNIQTVAAIPDNIKNGVKLLVPLDYAESAKSFTEVFLHRNITVDKERLSYAIAALFLKTKRRNLLCCDQELKAQMHEHTWQGDTLVVNTTFVEQCCDCWIKADGSPMEDYPSSIKTKFTFNQHTLTAINYSEWQK